MHAIVEEFGPQQALAVGTVGDAPQLRFRTGDLFAQNEITTWITQEMDEYDETSHEHYIVGPTKRGRPPSRSKLQTV